METTGGEMADTFIRVVESKRKQLGLTQGDFAEFLRVDRSTLSRFLSGERRSPTVAAAVAVAFPELKDMALLFLVDDVPERNSTEQRATLTTESPRA